MSRLEPIGLAALASLITASAYAQMETRTKGIPIGEKSALHAGLDLGAGFDTNPERLQIGSEDWKGTIRPRLSLTIPGEEISFGLRGKISIDHYFQSTELGNQVGGDLGLTLKLGKGPVSVEVKNAFTRTPTFFDEEGTVSVDELRFVQWHDSGQATLRLAPGGGALEFRIGYTLLLEIYDDLPDASHHGMHLSARLKFLPKTAAVFQSNVSFYSANDSDQRRAFPYNVMVGLHGQLTSKLSAVADVGFGATELFEPNQSFFSGGIDPNNIRTVVAHLDLRYSFGRGTFVSAGYRRAVRPIIDLDAYTADTASLRLGLPIGDRFSFRAFGSYQFRNFAEGERSAEVVTVDGRIAYWLYNWLSASIAYQLLLQARDEGTETSKLLSDYERHQVRLFLGFRY
ncbi:MAG: hypothetical protein HY791_00415 [Deltaproteobacteria bacterium]|nr:hypothetical protein [Deltaproteobacteria bacterium]